MSCSKDNFLFESEFSMENSQKIFVLESTHLFGSLSDDIVAAVAKKTQEREIEKGTIIFHEGEVGDGLYVIVSGTISISKKNKTIAKLNEGDFFGELSLIDNTLRAASAIAKTDCILLFLDKEAFSRFMITIPIIEGSFPFLLDRPAYKS